MRGDALVRGLPWGVLAAVTTSQWAAGVAASTWILGTGFTPTAASLLFAGILAGNALWMHAGRRGRRPRTADLFRPGYLLTALISLSAAGGGILGSGAARALAWTGLAPHAPPGLTLLGAGLGVACLAYGFVVGQRRLRIERISLGLPALAPGLRGLRIAHLSDLHIGPRLRAPALGRFVEQVNATRPDLIVLTGDLFDFDPAYVEEGCRELAKLYAPHGVFAVLGNHDVYTGADTVQRGLEELTPVRLLRNAWVELRVQGDPLVLLGIDDVGRGLADRGIESPALERLASETATSALRLLLVHRPNYLPQIARLGIPLALAGHTHGGQLSLPWPLAQLNVARLTTPWTHGLFERGPTRLYVSRGLGVGGLSVRLNSPREIALLTLDLPERARRGRSLPRKEPAWPR